MISVKDIRLLFGFFLGGILCWFVPERFWRIFSYPIAFLDVCFHFKRSKRHTGKIYTSLGLTKSDAVLIKMEVSVNHYEKYFQYLREYRPGGWKPRIQLRGREHIEEALKAGRGGVLWVAPFYSNQLIVKKALFRSGFGLNHLYAYNHGFGFSNTHFVQRFLNSIRVRIEKQFLDDIFVLTPPGGKLGYIRQLERLLRRNGLVSIQAGDMGEKHIECSVFGSKYKFATGAPSFALATQAVLLPVFTIRHSSANFEVIIEQSMDFPEANNRHETIKALAARYAERMESYIVRYPGQFMRWYKL